jgi:hypothetical protein
MSLHSYFRVEVRAGLWKCGSVCPKKAASTLRRVASVYWIGVTAGLGAAIGLLLSGGVAASRLAIAAPVAAAALGVVLGLAVGEWDEAVGGAVGGIGGGFGGVRLVSGTLRRGGTRGATGLLLGFGAVVAAALAFVPAVGYLEAVALPALVARLRRRAGQRYAGLRILARDE